MTCISDNDDSKHMTCACSYAPYVTCLVSIHAYNMCGDMYIYCRRQYMYLQYMYMYMSPHTPTIYVPYNICGDM